MPGLWESISEDVVLNALRCSRQNDHGQYKANCELAIDYLNNNQVRHVEAALLDRYPEQQQGDRGQEIIAVTLPLTERYIAEAASAYNKPVERAIVTTATGDEDEELTKVLREYLLRIGYDEQMHRNEQLSLLLSTSCVWYQEKRGQLRPVIAYPQDIYPIINPDDAQGDPADPEDYLGFVVEVIWGDDDLTVTNQKTYARVMRDGVTYYTAKDPYSTPDKILGTSRNPFTWPQYDEAGNLAERPLQMLTFWPKQKYESELIVKADPDIAFANHELNIQWSMLFDTARIQGWATLVLNLINPNKAGAHRKWGARFPLVMDVGESANMMTAPAPYSEISAMLQTYTKILAVAKRQSPNDFSIDQAAAISGFAKVVDSLPKIEARNERLRRLKRLEEQVAWPRIASILRRQGVLPADIAINYKLSVKFSDIEIPKSPDEIKTEVETDFAHGLSNPIDVLVERFDVSREEAEKIYEENKKYQNGGNGMPHQQGQLFGGGSQAPGALAKLIAQRKSAANEQNDKPSPR